MPLRSVKDKRKAGNNRNAESENSVSTLKRIRDCISPYGGFVILSILFALGSVATQLYIPILTGRTIDFMLGPDHVDFDAMVPILLQIAVTALVSAVFQWILSICNNHITYCLSRDRQYVI